MNINGIVKYTLLQLIPIIAFLLAGDSYTKQIDTRIAFIWFILVGIILLGYRYLFYSKIKTISEFAEIQNIMNVYKKLSTKTQTKAAFYIDQLLSVILTITAYFIGFEFSI